MVLERKVKAEADVEVHGEVAFVKMDDASSLVCEGGVDRGADVDIWKLRLYPM